MKRTGLLCVAACLLLGLRGEVSAQARAAARGDGTRTRVKYLSGTGNDDAVPWDFYCTAGRRSGAWSKIPVPSNWEQHGFGAYNFGRPFDEKTNPVARERGKYRLRFDAPEKEMRGLRWLGRGPYRVWQNRTHGTRLDVWETAYNDTTPGESRLYPEFKGYFRGWRWAAFDTGGGRLIAFNEAGDSHLGVYGPKDGRDGLLDLPETGLAFLDVIPAVGSKFQPPDQLGPQSRQRRVSGTARGSVLFRFDAVTTRQK